MLENSLSLGIEVVGIDKYFIVNWNKIENILVWDKLSDRFFAILACSVRYNCLSLSIVISYCVLVINLSFLNWESNKAISSVISFDTS